MSSIGEQLSNAFDPEMYMPGSFGRFASNLVNNASELLGTDEQTNAYREERANKAKEYGKYLINPKRYYIPEDQLDNLKSAYEEENLEMFSNSPAAGSASRKFIKDLPEELYHVSPYSFDKFDLSKGTAGYNIRASGKGLYTTPNFDDVMRHDTEIRRTQDIPDYKETYLYHTTPKVGTGDKKVINTWIPMLDNVEEHADLINGLYQLGGHSNPRDRTHQLIISAIHEQTDRLIRSGINSKIARETAEDQVKKLFLDAGYGAKYVEDQLSSGRSKIYEVLFPDENDLRIVEKTSILGY